MSDAIITGATDLIDLARPLALESKLPTALVRDPASTTSSFDPKPLGIKKLVGAADVWWAQHQFRRIAAGKEPDPRYGMRRAVLSALRSNGVNTLRRRCG